MFQQLRRRGRGRGWHSGTSTQAHTEPSQFRDTCESPLVPWHDSAGGGRAGWAGALSSPRAQLPSSDFLLSRALLARVPSKDLTVQSRAVVCKQHTDADEHAVARACVSGNRSAVCTHLWAESVPGHGSTFADKHAFPADIPVWVADKYLPSKRNLTLGKIVLLK